MKIFISYRRADSKYVVDRIQDRLIAVYGEEAVFCDIENVPIGLNFSKLLYEATASCNVMRAVIGPQWATFTDDQGKRRLFNPDDFIRIEVQTGLADKEILVIPVLVMNSMMPRAKDLPESLSELLLLNAITIRNDPDFIQDMQKLIHGINRPETIHVPAGPFIMGSNAGDGFPDYERPQHEVMLPEYRIGIYPVTNAQYEEFIHQSGKLVTPGMVFEL